MWDYISFAVWFAGLGYIVMWLLRSPDLLLLPPALHVLGVASAMFVPVRLILRAATSRRQAATGAVTSANRPPCCGRRGERQFLRIARSNRTAISAYAARRIERLTAGKACCRTRGRLLGASFFGKVPPQGKGVSLR